MSKETLAELIERIEGFSKIGDEEKASLQKGVLYFGTYIAEAGERMPTRDMGGEIDTQGRFFTALHVLLDLSGQGIPEELLRKIIDLAGHRVGARYNPEYEIKEETEGVVFEERGV
ncbi:hypothetical protein CO054_01085 [Candidatus Shapirobacteria bacterium CG_4_9_14_0_2_um_filter_39_11]|uniref:Uncharacterized protein n=1 Tax=Candidatus Shapirobacteria bacterium CG_4_9_14_0_2_um_filter_39_11 TaxID=1974478 RepID=A0A2M8ET12_9BACT|nr:MAG: hypothetical protein CO054_01085 [Candidatus Shapirobacteria bacterium CG_4_9_14_0_2_um_filter_39_11]